MSCQDHQHNGREVQECGQDHRKQRQGGGNGPTFESNQYLVHVKWVLDEKSIWVVKVIPPLGVRLSGPKVSNRFTSYAKLPVSIIILRVCLFEE